MESFKTILQEVYEAKLLLKQLFKYLASTVLGATEFYFLLHREINAEPRMKQHPGVLFLYVVHLAQSKSVNLCNFKSHFESYRRLYPIVTRKYMSTCFAAIQ